MKNSARWDSQPVAHNIIYWCLASVGLVILPHLFHLPWWIILLTSILLVLRGYIHRSDSVLPGKLFIIFIMLISLSGIYLSYGAIFGRNPGVALMIIMLSLKSYELHTRRDVTVLNTLGFFTIMTHFLFDQSLFTAGYMLICTLIITATLIELNAVESATPQIKRVLRQSARIFIQAVPVMIVLFVLFPRINGPFWGLPDDAYSAKTGLSNTMSPGSINQLNQSGATAMRVEFADQVPDKKDLYWRGPVLWDFDGKTWSSGPGAQLLRGLPIKTDVPALEYTVTLEAHNQPWLLFLETPLSATVTEETGFIHPYDFSDPGIHRDRSRITSDLKLIRNKAQVRRIQYQGRSAITAQYDSLSRLAEFYSLRYPSSMHQDVIDLALGWRKQYKTPEQIAQAAINYFRNEPFVYTLQPGLLGEQPTADFLFNTRRGYCEHYASAFTLLMRIAGIPARVVTGYLGGELNPLDDYMIVKQSDAHAWTEIWLADRGWVRVDPTAAVAPDRIEQGAQSVPGLSAATTPILISQNRVLNKLWRQFRFAVDMVNNQWNIWVIAYGPTIQQQVLSVIGLVNKQRMILAMVALVLIFLGFYAWRMFSLKQYYRDRVMRSYALFCRKLEKRGLVRHPYEGPVDFAKRASRELPELRDRIESVTRLYTALRFTKDAQPQWQDALQRNVKQL